MKQLIILLFIICQASAAPWIEPAHRESYMQRVLPLIEDPKSREQAEHAMRAFMEAEQVDNINQALTDLANVDSPAAKVAALYYIFDPVCRKTLSSTLHFDLQELPLIVSWMVTNGMTTQDFFSMSDASSKSERLDMLASKVNEILATKGMPVSRNKIPGDGVSVYTPDELRLWAVEQIQWSLKHKTWAVNETRFLDELLSNLKVVKIPTLTSQSALIRFDAPIKSGGEQSILAKYTNSRLLWFLCFVLSALCLWWLMRRFMK